MCTSFYVNNVQLLFISISGTESCMLIYRPKLNLSWIN